MINPKIIKHVEKNSPNSNVSDFIKRLILFEESETGGWKWKETYQKELIKYHNKVGE